MKRPTYRMERVRLADCRPHADAEAFAASQGDRVALENSVAETGCLSPIAVVEGQDRKGYLIIDGIGRANALKAAGAEEADAQVFDLGDLTVPEFVVCKNSMMRKVTTGSRVMAYLRCHEREVLEAADPGRYRKRPGNGANFKGGHHAVSYETAADKGWNAKEIAARLGVSKNDVLAGVELLKASAEDGDGGGRTAATRRGPPRTGGWASPRRWRRCCGARGRSGAGGPPPAAGRRRRAAGRLLLPGERQVWDDASVNVAVAVPWAGRGDRAGDRWGWRAARYQLLAGIDCATDFLCGFGYVMRTSDGYRACDVANVMHRVWRQQGYMPRKVVLEGGSWQAATTPAGGSPRRFSRRP